MALPVMARASYVVLGVVSGGLREASYALGAGRWQTVWKVVLPTARPGLATALILGLARAVGETAPVLLTSGASTYFNANPLQDPMNSLPLYIYASLGTGSPAMEERAYAAAAVLLAVVLSLFLLARLVAGGRKSR
jgi:phosphate transport system permease protein